jgi:anti-sigma-K factor RskA
VDQWREHAAAYVLGALSTDERVEFEAHLLACVECTLEVRAFARLADALPYAAPPVDPPARLRDRVIAVAQTKPATAGLTATTVPPRSDSAAGELKPRATLMPWLLAAASLAMAVGLGAYSVALRRAASDAETVVIVLGASDLVRVELAGQPVAPRASARAFWSRSRGLVFTASNLPPPATGRTYQLWIIAGQTPVGAGLLKPGADGIVHAVFATPSDLANAVAIAVTIEPDGGVPAPTGDKYLVGLVN